MVGILLDTNIYGKIVEREENSEIAEKILDLRKDGRIVIPNFKVIRDEVRNARSNEILKLYDSLTANSIHVVDNKVEKLADLYFKKYRDKGGIQKKTTNFMNDLRIVAFATIKNVNIVCSEDAKAFHTNLARETYREVNLGFIYNTPEFYTLKDLKKTFL